jgi:tetratricopeptide (TPR) repeat protein
MRSPFDVGHTPIRMYKHLGEDISYSEAKRFRKELSEAIKAIMAHQMPDSPVYTFLHKLTPPSLGDGVPSTSVAPPDPETPAGVARAGEAAAPPPPAAPEPDPASQRLAALSVRLTALTEQVEQEVADGRFAGATVHFAEALGLLGDSQDGEPWLPAPQLTQRLARAASRVEGEERLRTLRQVRQMLVSSFSKDSTDPQTLELLGDLEFALYGETEQAGHLSRARQSYEKLYTLRPDHVVGTSLAHMVSLQAESRRETSEALYDVIYAGQLRREVVDNCKEALAKIDERYRPGGLLMKDAGKSAAQKQAEAARARLAVWEALAEAYYGLGDRENYLAALDEASLLQGGDAAITAVETRVTRLDSYVSLQSELLSAVGRLDAGRQRPESSSPPANAREYERVSESRGARGANSPAPDKPEPGLVFFSYTHKSDLPILEEIKKYLLPTAEKLNLHLWDDRELPKGRKWDEELKRVMSRAVATVLLVNADFLASDYIRKTELPTLLRRQSEEDILLLWVATGPVLYQDSELNDIQGVGNPEEPLSQFQGYALSQKIKDISMSLREEFMKQIKTLQAP